MSFEFKDSKGYTLGIEVEVQLIDRDTFALVPRCAEIVDSIGEYKTSIKHELMASNLEINTKICSNIKEAEEDLHKKFYITIKEAAKHNTLLSLAGTHPFSLWREQQITEDERYKRLLARLQIIAKRFNIFGLHVHIGIMGGDRCIYILNRFLYYLPHLLAVSANSPFWEGINTGLKSYRIKIFESLPIAGLPFYFKDWAEYRGLVDNYLATKTVETIRDIWWDIRPHPDFGTLEIRICDTPLTIREILALAALIQALTKRFSDEYDDGCPWVRPHAAVIRENKWRACRYGLDGEFMTEEGSNTVSIRESIENLLKSVQGEAALLHSEGYISHIYDMLKGGEGASRQLANWKQYGDLKKVVRDISNGLNKEVL